MLHPDPVITSLIGALADERPDFRRLAMRRLVRVGAPAAPYLVRALSHRNPDARRQVAVALVSLGKVAKPWLHEAQISNDPQRSEMARCVAALIGAAETDQANWADAWFTRVQNGLDAMECNQEAAIRAVA